MNCHERRICQRAASSVPKWVNLERNVRILEAVKTPSAISADDDGGLRNALKLALEARGYRVQVAVQGSDALVMQRNDPADVLITDIFMPGSDGFEAIDGFRSEFPGTKIVVMS